jgi:hypothetical protein
MSVVVLEVLVALAFVVRLGMWWRRQEGRS